MENVTQQAHCTRGYVKGIDLAKIGQIHNFFLLEKGLYTLVDQVSKHYGASATVNFPKTGPEGGNTSTFITFSENILSLLLSVILSLLK